MHNPGPIVIPQSPQPQPPVVNEPQLNTTPPKNHAETKVTPNRHSTSGFEYVKDGDEDNTHIKAVTEQSPGDHHHQYSETYQISRESVVLAN